LGSLPLSHIFGEMGKLHQISSKSDGALVRQLVVAKWCKMGNILLKEGYLPYILGKICKSPFTHFGGSVVNTLDKFQFKASLSLYYRSPDGAATKQTQCCCGE